MSSTSGLNSVHKAVDRLWSYPLTGLMATREMSLAFDTETSRPSMMSVSLLRALIELTSWDGMISEPLRRRSRFTEKMFALNVGRKNPLRTTGNQLPSRSCTSKAKGP